MSASGRESAKVVVQQRLFVDSWSAWIQTECTPKRLEFEAIGRRVVVAQFDGGTIASNAGALLLGQVNRGLGLIRRFAQRFMDRRDQRYVEHFVETLVGQRVFGLVLGCSATRASTFMTSCAGPGVCGAGWQAQTGVVDGLGACSGQELDRVEHTPKRNGAKYHKIATAMRSMRLSSICSWRAAVVAASAGLVEEGANCPYGSGRLLFHQPVPRVRNDG